MEDHGNNQQINKSTNKSQDLGVQSCRSPVTCICTCPKVWAACLSMYACPKHVHTDHPVLVYKTCEIERTVLRLFSCLLLRSQLCMNILFSFLSHDLLSHLIVSPSSDHFMGTNVPDSYCSSDLLSACLGNSIVLYFYCSPDLLFTYLGNPIVPSLLFPVLSRLVMVAALMYISWLISRVGP